MLTCHDVADYFLSLTDEEAGDLISNLKLQKLVYYAQGYHLALFDRPLFNEPINAWTHGPVVPVLYHRFKEYGAGAIPTPESLDLTKIPTDVRELLDEVYDVLGQFSAWKLRNMTHEELPWLEAKDKPGNLIAQDSMREYFKTQLN
ncbi:type II toxin-antitoxin system antitoxin SocA domain-containing protein [Desulfoluna sp.]|uniref:Panacea domain-containing protein n=1 Tax=Desulfoluna sp. TaxID=2045199 RepID=UPI00261EE697|nr:type II toxin-antitoxin system antitoxin SocA domain-containing protein [Desulfoluna sp.]